MKIKILVTGFLSMLSVAALAQKSALNDANNDYGKYTVEKQSQLPELVTLVKLHLT